MDKVVHFEIPIKDRERAKKFYSQIFGWQINQVGDVSGNNYFLANTVSTDEKGLPQEPGAINGALTVDEQVSHTIITIKVNDIDSYLKKIKKAGGSVIMNKVKVGDFGMYARFKDSEGNLISLWQDVH